jgi:hypothetical protein
MRWLRIENGSPSKVGPLTAADWTEFKELMWRNHLIIVGDQHMPEFLRVKEPA